MTVGFCAFPFLFFFFLFFFNDPAPTEIYTLSLHDALPIFDDAAWVITRVERRGDQLHGVLNDGSEEDRKSTRLNSSHPSISYAVFCLKKKKKTRQTAHRHNHDKKQNKRRLSCL